MKYSIAFLAVVAAVQASPVPAGVTSDLAPTASAPSGCMPTYSGSFGVVVQNITAAGAAAVTQKSDGQPNANTAAAVSQIADGQLQASSAAVVSQISDGQPQAATAAAVNQISDGQIQATQRVTMNAVTQISDGQIQATYMAPVSQISDGQIQASAKPVSQIADGQPQAATTAAPVSQIADGQPQAATTAAPVSQIADGQPQAATTGAAVSQIADGQVQASSAAGSAPAASSAPQMVACSGDGVLTLTLDNGVLKDDKGRTGYIASNYQFQFDSPPQAGAIYTSGFSVCGNGSLALGGSNVFYQCLSGDFYNLYDRHWAPQCSEVTIDVLELMNCDN